MANRQWSVTNRYLMRSDVTPAHQKGRFIVPQAEPKEMIVRPVRKSGQEQRKIDAPVPDHSH